MKALLLLTALAVSIAHAQQCTSLVYHGSPFTAVNASANNYLPMTSPLWGTMTLAMPLPANAVGYMVTPAAWDFTTQDSHLISPYSGFVNPFTSPPSFTFTTVNGVITDWTISINWDNGPTIDFFAISVISKSSGDAADLTYINAQGASGPMSIGGNSIVAGRWSCAPVPVVDPLIAQVAILKAQVASLSGEDNALYAEEQYLQRISQYWAKRAVADEVTITALLKKLEGK